MAKRHDSAHETPTDSRVLWDINGMSFELAEKAYRAWLASAGRIQNEALGFLNGRFEKGLAVARELTNCKTATDYLEVQAKYADSEMADWLTEGQKMAQLFGEVAKDTALSAEGAVHAAESTACTAPSA